uniref:Uncharacterized protein n=1 Tax=Zea mays TaxID=4577 RepID=B4FMA2_MAIZE|nr:unknown [Zea mays]
MRNCRQRFLLSAPATSSVFITASNSFSGLGGFMYTDHFFLRVVWWNPSALLMYRHRPDFFFFCRMIQNLIIFL